MDARGQRGTDKTRREAAEQRAPADAASSANL